EINASAHTFGRGGNAEAVGLDSSSLDTGSGDDQVEINADAVGGSTNAWGMRDSSLDTGSGDDNVEINATTNSTVWDPAYGAENSSIDTGSGDDSLEINANATGFGRGFVEAIGAVKSIFNLGKGDDQVQISASAFSSSGETNVVGLKDSIIYLGEGEDFASIKGGTVNSTILGASGDDIVQLYGENTFNAVFDGGDGEDELEVHGGYGITYITGAGSDKLIFTVDYYNSLFSNSWLSAEPLPSPVGIDPVPFPGPAGEDLVAEITLPTVPEFTTDLIIDIVNETIADSVPSFSSNTPLIITDFEVGDHGDSLNFDELLNNLAINYDGSNAFSSGYVSLMQDGDDTIVSFDVDGIAGDESSVVLSTLQNVDMALFGNNNVDSEVDIQVIIPTGENTELEVLEADLIINQPIEEVATSIVGIDVEPVEHGFDSITNIAVESTTISVETSSQGTAVNNLWTASTTFEEGVFTVVEASPEVEAIMAGTASTLETTSSGSNPIMIAEPMATSGQSLGGATDELVV
ncbi:hypothetical protein HI853_04470, partial [Cyanobacteria bacterium 150SLHA]|uniref:hypothetical protein n=1 Tax=Prochlorococcus sp.P1363 TaxID=2729590 RepID=UPI00181A0E6A